MARISIQQYIDQCDQTNQFFDGGFALELILECTPADPSTSDPVEILSALEEIAGESINHYAQRMRRAKAIADVERLSGQSIEELANELQSIHQVRNAS